MQNKSHLKLRVLMIVIGIFLGHICMDVFKIGVKDGEATTHVVIKKK